MVQSTDNSLQLLVTEVHSPDGSQYQCLQINIFGQLLEPVTLNGLELPVDLDLNRGVVLWGSAPIWLYSYLVLRCKQAPWMGCYNVPLGRFVVVASRCEEMVVGDTFQLINKSQGIVILIGGSPNSGKSVFCHALNQTLSQILPDKKVHLYRARWDGEGDWYAQMQNQPLAEELSKDSQSKVTEQSFLYQANAISNIRKGMDLVLVDFGDKPSSTNVVLLNSCTHYIIISNNSESISLWHNFCGSQGGLKPLAVIHSVLEEQLEVLQTEPYLEIVASTWIRGQTRTIPDILIAEVLKLLNVESTGTEPIVKPEADRLLQQGIEQFQTAQFQRVDRLTLDSRLGDLPTHDFEVSLTTLGEVVATKFQQHPELPGVIITADNQLVGIIYRTQFFERLSRPYGLEIFLKRPIRSMLKMIAEVEGVANLEALTEKYLILDSTCTIDKAVELALSRPASSAYKPILIQWANGRQRLLDMQVLLLAQTQLLALAENEADAANKQKNESQDSYSRETSLNKRLDDTDITVDITAVIYEVLLSISSKEITVGSELEVSIRLIKSTGNVDSTSYLLEVQNDEAIGGEVNIFITAPGFHSIRDLNRYQAQTKPKAAL